MVVRESHHNTTQKHHYTTKKTPLSHYHSSAEKVSKMIVSCKASKTSVSRKASHNFHRRRFQNDRFVRGFAKISQKKLAKRVSCKACSKFTEGFLKFHRAMLPRHNRSRDILTARLLSLNFSCNVSGAPVLRHARSIV